MSLFKNRSENRFGDLLFVNRTYEQNETYGLWGMDPRLFSWICSLLIGLGFVLVYGSVLPNQPTRANYGGDGADFLAAMLTGGIPHPTGYPVYTLLGRLFLLLPISTPYFRVALLSAGLASVAVTLAFQWVWRSASRQSGRLAWLAALTAALAWGSSPMLWSQAVIVEVHALQAVFLLAWLGWISALLAWGERPVSVTGLVALSFAAGFSLGNHLTILLMLPAVGLGQFLAVRRGMPARLLLLQGMGLALGGLVYLYLPWQARGWPPVNWGNAQTWSGFWWMISGEPYQGLVFGASAGQWLERSAAWGRQMLIQFSLPGLLIGGLGLMKAPTLKPEARLLSVWVFGIYSVFALGYNTHDALVYLIPVYLAFAVWVGQGAAFLWPLVWRGWPVGRSLGLVVLALLLGRMLFTRGTVDPRSEIAQADFAQSLLSQAPAGAFLLSSGDADSFPLWYYHFGLGQRQDVRVVVQPLTKFRWYQETLQKTYPDLVTPLLAERQDGGWADQLVRLNPGRPVCHSFEAVDSAVQIGFTCQGGNVP